MPYLTQKDKISLEKIGGGAVSAGELNYSLTQICLNYLGDSPRYQRYNEIVGALECCKLEFYRRAVAPYEDKKIKENGDVY